MRQQGMVVNSFGRFICHARSQEVFVRWKKVGYYPQVLKNVRVENKETVEGETLRKAIQESEARLAGNGRVLVRPSAQNRY